MTVLTRPAMTRRALCDRSISCLPRSTVQSYTVESDVILHISGESRC